MRLNYGCRYDPGRWNRVQEFRLITNSFSAEFGKFTAFGHDYLTKLDTNSFHGTCSVYRNRKWTLDHNTYFDRTKAE